MSDTENLTEIFKMFKSDEPSNPTDGTMWYDDVTGLLFCYENNTWESVAQHRIMVTGSNVLIQIEKATTIPERVLCELSWTKYYEVVAKYGINNMTDPIRLTHKEYAMFLLKWKE